MFCPDCGKALGNLDQSCSSCGSPISRSPVSEAVPENPTSTNAPLIIGIALALLAVILIIGFLVFSGGGESDAIALAATAKATSSVLPTAGTEAPPPPVTEPPAIQLDPEGLGPLSTRNEPR